MSTPTALLVSRYRAFAGDETLPLRAITLLYGRNNSGTSALARALALIGASVIPPTAQRALRDGDQEAFLAERNAWLVMEEQMFIESLGFQVSEDE